MNKLIIRKVLEIEPNSYNSMVDWMYHWWGADEGYSLDEVKCYMAHSLNDVRFPQTYGLFLDNEIIGMYQFTYSDLDIRPDIYPWLANVFIREDYRGNGYMKLLIDSAKENAVKSGLTELYLFTEHIGLYEKYGFVFAEEIDTFKKTPRIQRLYRLNLS
ncbi:MAG: GNAT family N-acetyltransferase [Christensenellaceae bacterium]|nr:GNAT family N-acetyltransferase [Christensenellaceae bacterium]